MIRLVRRTTPASAGREHEDVLVNDGYTPFKIFQAYGHLCPQSCRCRSDQEEYDENGSHCHSFHEVAEIARVG